MSGEFGAYFRLGVEHLLDLAGYDHLLFLLALVGTLRPGRWQPVVWLVTAFTVGHTLTLALATLELVHVNSAVVEAMIPATIMATSGLALWELRRERSSVGAAGGPARGSARPHDDAAVRPDDVRGARWSVALLFGLIHGLGFSALLRQLLGGEESILLPLLAFNLGLEVAQLFVVACVVFLSVLLVRSGLLSAVRWRATVATSSALLATYLLIQRLS